MHYYGHSKDAPVATPKVYRDHSQGYTQAPLITHASGSVHTGTSLNFLAAGGFIAPHLHSFEVGVYILEGHVTLGIGERAYQLAAGDYAALKVGTVHSWRNTGASPVRWLRMAAPQPKPEGKERDTFFVKGGFVNDSVAASTANRYRPALPRVICWAISMRAKFLRWTSANRRLPPRPACF